MDAVEGQDSVVFRRLVRQKAEQVLLQILAGTERYGQYASYQDIEQPQAGRSGLRILQVCQYDFKTGLRYGPD